MEVQSQFIEMFDLSGNSKHWPVLKFNDFATLDCKMTTDFDFFANHPHIGIDSIEQNTGRLYGYRTVSEDNVKSGKYIFTPKHIIYSKIRPNLNKVAIPDFEGLCSADSYPVLANEKVTSRVFLAFLMRSEVFLDYIVPLSNRTGMPKANRDQVEGFTCPMPPKTEQDRFVAILEQADKSKFVGFKSQFIEMFGTIDEPKVEVKKLIDVVLSSGQYGSNTSATDYQQGKPRYIRITDINDDGSLNEDIKTAEVIEDKYKLVPGDLVFARTGATVGKTYLHESGDAIYAGYLIKYQMNESLMRPAFMKAFTHSKTYYNWVANSQKVGAQPNISATQYDNMPVLVPQIERQDEFLAIYNQADKSKYYNQVA